MSTDPTTPATNETEPDLPVGGPGLAFMDTCVANSTPGLGCLPYGTNTSGLDPERLIFPYEGVNYTGCEKDILASDFDGNQQVSKEEYESFVYKTAVRRCQEWPELTLEQELLYNSLACECKSSPDQRADCCIGDRSHLPTNGALEPDTRSPVETVFLERVCTVTYGTLPGTNCSIIILPTGNPPPVIVTPFPGAAGTANGNRWTLVAAMLATALLFLLCCCCCCGARNRYRKDAEEEELIEEEFPGKEEIIEEPLQEAAPRAIPPVAQSEDLVAEPGERESPPMDEESEYSGSGDNRGGGYEDDEESDGEGRKRRGGNYVGEPEEDVRRRWPDGEIPDPQKDRETVVLKPIPPKEKIEEEWDYPMRDIQEIKPEPDEMSGQEFERHIPETGVVTYDRPQKDPVTWKNDWERGEKPEGDEYDDRKHRIQAGMGEGEIWDRLEQDSNSKSTTRGGGGGDAFDWVVQSAINVMDTADQQGHLSGDDESTQPPSEGGR